MEALLQEKTVDMNIVKLNVTDSEIARLKEQYLPLFVNGIEDKEGLKRVYAARQEVKKLRVSLEKYADELKEDALRWQKKVVAEKNRVVAEFKIIENHLQAEEDKIAEEKERIRQEEERKEQERIQKRIDRLAEYGYAIDITFLKTISDEDFEKVVDNSKQQHELELQKKAEEERLRKQEEERLKAEREELERLRAQQAEAQRIIDEQNRKIKEEEERQAEERERLQKEMARTRTNQLVSLGFAFDFNNKCYRFDDLTVDLVEQIQKLENDKWDALYESLVPSVEYRKKIEEERRQLELEQLKKEAAETALREKQEEEERQRLAEVERLAQASDKVKFKSVIDQLNAVSIPEMKSAKAKRLAKSVQEVIDNAKALIQNSI